MRVVQVAAGALFDPQGRVLLAERPAGKPMAGLWEFPGGKIEPQETPEAALIRELREELGIIITAPAPLSFVSHSYESFHLVMLLFSVTSWQGSLKGQQGQELRWVDPGKIAEFPMPAADYPLLPAVQSAANARSGR